jgi:hypothetical protein
VSTEALPDSAIEVADAAAEIALSDSVRYDCDGIEPNPMEGPCESSAPGDDLIAISDELAEVTAGHAPPSSGYWGPATHALDRAESVDPATLAIEERVALQNAAFHLARVSTGLVPALAERARKLVKRLAFRERPVIIADLEPWLGPKSEWTQRSVPIVPFVHEQFFASTRVLRIVRTKIIRANFSQLIAFDQSGKPFVTNVIGSIEIRRGFAADATACVIAIDPARLRCKRLAGMRAIRAVKDLPRSPFLGHYDTTVKCNSCHFKPDEAAGLKVSDGFDPDHDRKVLEGLGKAGTE